MNIAAALSSEMPGVSPGVYGAHDFRAIAEIVHDTAGIVLPAGKSMLVYSRIAPLVRESGCGTFSDYVTLIRNDAVERNRTVFALTTNHTYFYREAHHFEHFAATVRPTLLSRLDANIPVRIWSAGCSSGEETWSLVMTLLGEDRVAGRHIAQRDGRVLASDIAPHALIKARAARYDDDGLRKVPEGLRRAWTQEVDGQVEIAAEARSVVRFRSLNLLGDWPMAAQFDVIFCRNVMIYFDTPTKERLIARFAARLAPGGHLYIGHSERVTGPATGLLEPVGHTIYRRKA